MKYYQAFVLSSSLVAIMSITEKAQAEKIDTTHPFALNNKITSDQPSQLDPQPASSLKKPDTSYTEPSNHADRAWNGPYIGLMFGYEAGTSKLSSPGTSGGAFSNNIAFQGPGAELVAGWGKTFSKFYLGLEAAASLFDSEGKASAASAQIMAGQGSTLTTKVTKKGSLGFAVRGGYKVHEKALIYAKAGVASSKFDLNFTNNSTISPEDNFSRTLHKRLTGVAAGLGTEIKFTDRILGRLEASHIQYGKKKTELPDGFSNTTFKPQSNEVKLGIVVPIGGK